MIFNIAMFLEDVERLKTYRQNFISTLRNRQLHRASKIKGLSSPRTIQKYKSIDQISSLLSEEAQIPNYQSTRNDYEQNFVDSGARPHNFIRDTDLHDRFDEYPKLKELTRLKNELVEARATPPTYLKADLRNFDFKRLGCKFDVILIDPPLEEYCRRSATVAGKAKEYWTFDEIGALRIEEIAANPSFIFIWVADNEGLDRGRELLLRWGYRRCEDIVWVKTNRSWEGSHLMESRSVLQHTKEHCLMGIRGTVRRSTDGHFIHCNVDTDVIISEEPYFGSTRKPEELYHIIEHFCLGRRRLELFGEDYNIRRGWLTIGKDISISNFDSKTYSSYFLNDGHLLGSTQDIELLRPKSPTRDPNQKAGSKKKANQALVRGPLHPGLIALQPPNVSGLNSPFKMHIPPRW
ncbi:uncharacterized protein VTP21DRAFT_1003 [Calcarisporiella thermophila]|uniref:uncharacterized protein n=1 Tax=Calcarisporiella thermophila TaxID=911321 RepID=UPI003743B7C1